MYDLHIHSLLSDGSLLPSEIARRYEAKGYKAIAITDHVDSSNIREVTEKLSEFIKSCGKAKIKILPGVEITHIALSEFKPLVKFARQKGMQIIVGHGETLVEPVIKGTNKAALEAGIDILAHPGLISDEDVKLAVKRGAFLEITSRKGHSLSNGHVVKQALRLGAKLAINSDSHNPEDIISLDERKGVGLGAGLVAKDFQAIEAAIQQLVSQKLR